LSYGAPSFTRYGLRYWNASIGNSSWALNYGYPSYNYGLGHRFLW
jgi:hypothetical protein